MPPRLCDTSLSQLPLNVRNLLRCFVGQEGLKDLPEEFTFRPNQFINKTQGGVPITYRHTATGEQLFVESFLWKTTRKMQSVVIATGKTLEEPLILVYATPRGRMLRIWTGKEDDGQPYLITRTIEHDHHSISNTKRSHEIVASAHDVKGRSSLLSRKRPMDSRVNHTKSYSLRKKNQRITYELGDSETDGSEDHETDRNEVGETDSLENSATENNVDWLTDKRRNQHKPSLIVTLKCKWPRPEINKTNMIATTIAVTTSVPGGGRTDTPVHVRSNFVDLTQEHVKTEVDDKSRVFKREPKTTNTEIHDEFRATASTKTSVTRRDQSPELGNDTPVMLAGPSRPISQTFEIASSTEIEKANNRGAIAMATTDDSPYATRGSALQHLRDTTTFVFLNSFDQEKRRPQAFSHCDSVRKLFMHATIAGLIEKSDDAAALSVSMRGSTEDPIPVMRNNESDFDDLLQSLGRDETLDVAIRGRVVEVRVY